MRLKCMPILRKRKANTFWFKSDGRIPNNPDRPFIVYKSVADLDNEKDPAAFFEDLFRAHGWGRDWRNGIYKYEHYHGKIHEVLGIAAGSARIRFGGKKGRVFKLKAGDVAILPAGTGHECLASSKKFLVVGAYPREGIYDEGRGSKEDHDRALKTIPKVALPQQDPIYGKSGPLRELWGKTGR